MIRNPKSWARIVAVILFLAVAAAPAAAQDYTWVENRFHRVHLVNGNFIDGQVTSVDKDEVVLRLPVGEMAIRKSTVDRIELEKMRSLLEKPKLDPPLNKKAAGVAKAAGAPRAKAAGAFPPAPASEELIANVASILGRLKIAQPDQKETLV